MKQNQSFISAREKVKNYLNFSAILGGGKSSTYAKLSGGFYNGIQNGDLTTLDIERINEKLDVTEASIKEFRDELNKGI